MKGTLYLLPVTLGGDDFRRVIPEHSLEITRHLRNFAVENIRSARRFLRLIDRQFPVDECNFYELSEHTRETELPDIVKPLDNGMDIGLMSEAGLPGVADPGTMLVRFAHREKIKVVPLSGPSSIILALISSGLNGQNFTFNGYLPVSQPERESKLRELEKRAKQGISQIFMETPYRNQKMLTSILTVCNRNVNLCIAADITLPSETIQTKPVSEWQKSEPDLKDRLVIFILQ